MTSISINELVSKIKLYMTPPGNGVFTVKSGSEKRIPVQKKLFGEKAVLENNVVAVWEQGLLENIKNKKTIMLGIPSDTGGGIQRGANWGPLYLRESLLKSGETINAYDIGDVRVVPQLLHDKYLNDETIKAVKKVLYHNEAVKLPVSPLSIAYDFAQGLYDLFPEKRLFMIGGDHSVSYPLVRAYLEAKKKQGKKVALVHFDAHTDLLTDRMGIDICFGTWTSQIIPYLDSSEHLVQIGIRSSARDKEHWEKTFGHKQYWCTDVLKRGPQAIADEIIALFEKLAVEEIYISFDIDCLDIEYAGATGTPESGGLSPHEPMVILHSLYEKFKITGSDMVEIAPMVKAPEVKQIEPETTLLVASAISTFLIQAMEVDYNDGHS